MVDYPQQWDYNGFLMVAGANMIPYKPSNIVDFNMVVGSIMGNIVEYNNGIIMGF